MFKDFYYFIEKIKTRTTKITSLIFSIAHYFYIEKHRGTSPKSQSVNCNLVLFIFYKINVDNRSSYTLI